jgi:hypothetical protein
MICCFIVIYYAFFLIFILALFLLGRASSRLSGVSLACLLFSTDFGCFVLLFRPVLWIGLFKYSLNGFYWAGHNILVLEIWVVRPPSLLLDDFVHVQVFECIEGYLLVLLKHLVRQLIIDVDFIFAVEHMQIVAVWHVFTLNLFQKVFAILYRAKYRC